MNEKYEKKTIKGKNEWNKIKEENGKNYKIK